MYQSKTFDMFMEEGDDGEKKLIILCVLMSYLMKIDDAVDKYRGNIPMNIESISKFKEWVK